MTDLLTDLEYYMPLVQAFIQGLESLTIPKIKEMPEPFLPLFGKDYERSELRIIFSRQLTFLPGHALGRVPSLALFG